VRINSFNTAFTATMLSICLLGWSALLVSCSTLPGRIDDDDVPKPNVNPAIQDVGTISSAIDASADAIDAEVEQIGSVVPPDVKDEIQPRIQSISEETDSLRENSQQLVDVQEQLRVEQQKIEAMTGHAVGLEREVAKLEEKIKTLESENKSLLRKMLAWLAAACVAGIGICVLVVFLTQNKLFIFGAIACALTMCVAVAASILLTWIAYITAGVFAIVSIGVGIYVWKQIVNKKKEMNTVNKALEEVVQSSEITKKYLDTDARNHIFGDGPEPGVVDQIQSPATKVLVRNLRETKVKVAPSNTNLFRTNTTLEPQKK
jgi:polyhydroxyalkanoate synthesis regulator phasin